MIDLHEIRKTVSTGLRKYLDIPVIRGNQTARAPQHPYAAYNVTTIATKNGGTYQQHEDGIDRKLVKSIMSLSFVCDDYDESVMYATKAREWFEHSGRAWLSERGVIVQSTTDITNRDNILSVEYERKNGFDVVFYVYDEAKSLTETNGFIEGAEIAHEIKH